MFVVLPETGDKFIWRYRRRSKLVHHNCAPVVSDFRRVSWSRSADEPTSEQRHGGSARARDIA